jgi:hypothetical protein
MSSQGYSISKTSFLKFEQCSKAFFLYKNHPYLRDKLSVDKQLTFRRGHDVGYFAQQLFPGGIDVSKETANAMEAVDRTTQLIQAKTQVIYEASFLFNGVLIMADILVLHEGKYLAYEVKSSIKVSEVYLKDAYLQYYVLKNSLPDFEDLFLVTLNPDYVLEEEIEPKKLFRKRSVKQKAEENFSYLEHQINGAHQVLEQNAIPNIAIGKHCFRPYQCDYFGTCWKEIFIENSIFNLPLIDRTKLFEWHSAGIKTIDQLPDDVIEKPLPIKIKNAITSNEPIIDREKINRFLGLIKEPLAAMDMEIWNPAIPQLKGTSPFEQIPFLVCVYDGEKNSYFFADHNGDDRKLFAEKLIELTSDFTTIAVYDKTMEVAAINKLIARYPELEKELGPLKDKLVDVFDIFLGISYYHPAFKGNFSLKAVTDVLLGDVGYTKINSGLEAMSYFEQYRIEENEIEKTLLKEQLIEYCATDSLATLKLIGFLKNLSA